MSCIGEFTKDGQNYRGHIRTLEINTAVTLQHNHSDKGKDAPNYTAIAENGAQIGSARIKTANHSGKDYVRLTVDDPSLSQPIHANLIEKDGKHLLMHSRTVSRNRNHEKTQEKTPEPERG